MQNLCLLPPERFVQLVSTQATKIDKTTFVKLVSLERYVHDTLLDTFIESYKTDTFYNDVVDWYNLESDESPAFPPNCGKRLPYVSDEPDSMTEGRNRFYIDENGILFYMD